MDRKNILVNEKQKGNPILKYIRLIPWQFSKDTIPDYAMGSTCAIFLSLKYHLLHSKYIDRKIADIGKNYKLRILLLLIDDLDNTQSLLELNRICFVSDFTLILAWSNEECGRYLETLKHYEDKPSTAIQEKAETEFLPILTKSLTTIKSINKTDVTTLLDSFGSLKSICQADENALMMCPGVGEKKVKRLYQALHEPFIKKSKTVLSPSSDALYTSTYGDISSSSSSSV